ncbi:protocatechuate 3,4-dioxygenase [Marinomonas algicola]|uniref:protocatechuate 3,4-dioxygenase n=1 Tax=Marinomonas algicola TaxID=2773454 RepID=UPI001748B1A4|nr:protocatechuate 3,4-dioxygenase [Marinomonas algicola]
MAWQKHDYDDIPGTYVFDGQRANSAFNLNKMAFSLNDAANRDEFAADMDAYCRRFNVTDEQRKAVVEGNFLEMLRLGGNIYYLAKLATFHGLNMQDAGASFHNITTEEFKQILLDNAEGFKDELEKRGGYWNG